MGLLLIPFILFIGYATLRSLLAVVKLYNRKKFNKYSLLWGSILFLIVYAGNHILIESIYNIHFMIPPILATTTLIIMPTVITKIIVPESGKEHQPSLFYQSLHICILLSAVLGLLYWLVVSM